MRIYDAGIMFSCSGLCTGINGVPHTDFYGHRQ